MPIHLKQLLLLSLLTSCSGSSGGDAGSDQPKSQIPTGETEVFAFNDQAAFGSAPLGCSRSGYGYAVDENLNKMVVCCVAINNVSGRDGLAKFMTRAQDRVIIKPEHCDAAILSGNIGTLALPVDIDLTAQKYVAIGGDKPAALFNQVSGLVSVTGSAELDTKLVGAMPLKLSGKSKVTNIHALGTGISYVLQDSSGFNDLAVTNVKIEGHGILSGGLELSTGDTSTRATTGMTMKFENVKVVSDKINPVLLVGYPFDISGVEILAGKKYVPHVGLVGNYADTTGVIKETRYPVSPSLQMLNGSKLAIAPGVKLKIPSSAPGKSGFRGYRFTLVLEGTAENRIAVTSFQDDSVGGDSNGDGNATKGDLIQLVIRENGDWRADNCSILMHNVDLFGVSIDVEKAESKVQLGNVTFRPAQDGTTWRNPVSLRQNGTNPQLILDDAVEAWHPIETYLDRGELKLSTLIYNGAYASINGFDGLTVHNTSTLPTRIEQDVRVLARLRDEGCKSTYDSNGQSTADTKNWTYYIQGNQLQVCK